MRILKPAPATFIDSVTSLPAFGSYRGPLPPVHLGEGLVDRALRRKKWIYIGIASEEIWLSMAVVRMGYATNAFAFVFDRKDKRMLADETVVGPPRAADIVDDVHVSGVLARFGFGRTSIAIERRGESTEVRARFGELQIDATLDETPSPPPISAIANLDGSKEFLSATEKRVLTSVRGSITIGGDNARKISLDQAVGGYDYTHGLMPRHTKWRWAFGLGRARDGAPIAFNVTSGFVGEAECAVFRAGKDALYPLSEPRFDFDVAHPEKPWKLVADGVDLTFDVGAVHAQNTNLVIVRSRFLQPTGTFKGTLRVGDEDVFLDDVPGVVEDQDVLW